jgi:nitronate monooxygenase
MGIQVANALGARAAMDAGADYLVCQGIEAGGHVQSSMPLRDALAAVLDVAAETPVLAAGGIGDGHDLKRVLDAGASGAVLGTRFVATRESLAHGVYKDALVRAAATDTVLTLCFDGGWPQALHRIIRNGTFNLWEAAGCPAPGQRPGEGDVVAHRRGAAMPRYWSDAPLAGDDGAVGDLPLYAGTSVDRVHDEPTVSELVQRLWSECRHP